MTMWKRAAGLFAAAAMASTAGAANAAVIYDVSGVVDDSVSFDLGPLARDYHYDIYWTISSPSLLWWDLTSNGNTNYYDASGAFDFGSSFPGFWGDGFDSGVTAFSYSLDAPRIQPRPLGGYSVSDAPLGLFTLFAPDAPGATYRVVVDATPLARGLAGVPEPATWAMTLVGIGALGALARSRRRPMQA